MELAISLLRNEPCSSEFNAKHVQNELSQEDVKLNTAKSKTDGENSEAEFAILSSLPQGFHNVIQQCSAAESMTITIRANCLTEEDFALWLDEYKSNTRTSWISDRTFPNAIHHTFKKKFVCQFSSRNKGTNSAHHRSRNKSCTASLSVSIKKITRNTKKTDPFLRQGLPAVIKIKNNHSHLIKDAHILSMLSMSSATKDRFLTYFNKGMTPLAAISYHVSELKMTSGQQDLADASVNPLADAVYHLHTNWRKEQLYDGSTLEGIEKLPIYSESGHVQIGKSTCKSSLSSKEKPYICKICAKTFSATCTLKNHERSHNGENRFVCKICAKAFDKLCDLKTHGKSHSGEMRCICETCGKAFHRLSGLKVHRRIHSGETLYVCERCGKSFRKSGYLEDHARVHTGEKPHTCRTCGRAFSSSSTLRHHGRVHSGERPQVRKTCGKVFRQLRRRNARARVRTSGILSYK